MISDVNVLLLYVQWNGILWHASQIKSIRTNDGIKVGLLYNSAGYVM